MVKIPVNLVARTDLAFLRWAASLWLDPLSMWIQMEFKVISEGHRGETSLYMIAQEASCTLIGLLA